MEKMVKGSRLTFTAAPTNRFANCSSPPARAMVSHFAVSIPTPSLTSSPSPMATVQCHRFSPRSTPYPTPPPPTLLHNLVEKIAPHHGTTLTMEGASSRGGGWRWRRLEGKKSGNNGLREQDGVLAMVVAERSRSGWRTRVLEREEMVIVDEGENVELEGEEKGEKSPRTLMRSPDTQNYQQAATMMGLGESRTNYHIRVSPVLLKDYFSCFSYRPINFN